MYKHVYIYICVYIYIYVHISCIYIYIYIYLCKCAVTFIFTIYGSSYTMFCTFLHGLTASKSCSSNLTGGIQVVHQISCG